MSYYRYTYSLLCFFLALLSATNAFAQSSNGINYQGMLIENGQAITDQSVYLRFGILNSLDELEYEEEQALSSNSIGIVSTVIGFGISTGNALVDSVNHVNWDGYPFNIEIYYKFSETDSYELLEIKSINSVVYAYASKYSSNDEINLSQFIDVSLSDSINPGSIFKYSEGNWSNVAEAEVALNALYSDSALLSDTAAVALMTNTEDYLPDSLHYALFSDSSEFSVNTELSSYTDYVNYSDSSLFTYNIINGISLNGDSNTLNIGSIDSVSYSLLSNSIERLEIKGDGSIVSSNGLNETGISLYLKSGILLETQSPISGLTPIVNTADGFIWNGASRSLHIGEVELLNLADSGLYAFSGGKLSKANSYSFTWGENNFASGNNVVVFGKNSQATKKGLNQFASGVAIGNFCNASYRSVAMGDSVRCLTGSTNIGFGKSIVCTGSTNLALGYSIETSGSVGSAAIGKSIINNGSQGSFVFADAAHSGIEVTEDARFSVLASGGVEIYSDTLMLVGVELSPGSGTWTSTSSRFKKRNIQSINYDKVDALFAELDIFSWNYRTQDPLISHIGPISNDLIENGLFNLELINSMYALNASDIDGLILLGTKSLLNKIEDLEKENEKDVDLKLQEFSIEDLEMRITKLENGINHE